MGGDLPPERTMGIRISNVTDEKIELDTAEHVDVEYDVIRKNQYGKPVEIVIKRIYG